MVLDEGEKKGSGGNGQRSRACELAYLSSGSAGARASRGERGGERRGPTVQQVADVEAASGDTRGRPKAVGAGDWGAAAVLQSTVARSRACFWLPLALPAVQGVSNGVQRVEGVVNYRGVVLDALGATGKRREVKKRVKTAARIVNLEFYPPPIIELRP